MHVWRPSGTCKESQESRIEEKCHTMGGQMVFMSSWLILTVREADVNMHVSNLMLLMLGIIENVFKGCFVWPS